MIIAWLCSHAVAAADWYTIEVVIFSQLDAANVQSERWPASPGQPKIENSVEPRYALGAGRSRDADDPLLRGPIAYQLLRRDSFTMTREARRIRNTRRYDVLYHAAWRQPGLAKNESRALHIRSSDKGTARANIDGTIRVWRSRFLHVELDLLMRTNRRWAEFGAVPLNIPANGANEVMSGQPSTLSSSTADRQSQVLGSSVIGGANTARALDDLAAFRLADHRRMRSKELHYIDHPTIGVLIKAERYARAEIPPQAPAATPEGTTQATPAPAAVKDPANVPPRKQ
jgi:hypothetical protein